MAISSWFGTVLAVIGPGMMRRYNEGNKSLTSVWCGSNETDHKCFLQFHPTLGPQSLNICLLPTCTYSQTVLIESLTTCRRKAYHKTPSLINKYLNECVMRTLFFLKNSINRQQLVHLTKTILHKKKDYLWKKYV